MENDTQHKTPKNLTNNKQGEALKESPDQIVDETVYIENFYDQQNIEEQKKSMAKLPQPPQLDGNEDLDMDYSQTHLEEFLRSNGAGNHGASGQQLLQSFMSTYNKTKGVAA